MRRYRLESKEGTGDGITPMKKKRPFEILNELPWHLKAILSTVKYFHFGLEDTTGETKNQSRILRRCLTRSGVCVCVGTRERKSVSQIRTTWGANRERSI